MTLTQTAYNELLDELMRVKRERAELLTALKALVEDVQDKDNRSDEGASQYSDEMIDAQTAIERAEKKS
jgi:hypothetical protein